MPCTSPPACATFVIATRQRTVRLTFPAACRLLYCLLARVSGQPCALFALRECFAKAARTPVPRFSSKSRVRVMASGQLTNCVAWTLARFHDHNLEANSAHRLAAREPFRHRTPTADRSHHLAVFGARVVLTIEACRVLRPQLARLSLSQQGSGPVVPPCSSMCPRCSDH